MFILTFAILGLLLGIAEVYDYSGADQLVSSPADLPVEEGNATSSEDVESASVATDD
jgi:hypothetical protein